jgi:FkbM family methyltransferase
MVQGKYNFIHAFEPSEMLAFVAVRNFELYNINNIELHRYALSDKEGAVSFDHNLTFQGLGAGRVSNTGSATVLCTSLDIFFKTKGGSLPSIIKMDIEGSEVAALGGAREIIGEAMPKLAICVYHKLEDLWEVPNKIHEAQTEKCYDYYLRHQGSFYDTVIFASPRK